MAANISIEGLNQDIQLLNSQKASSKLKSSKNDETCNFTGIDPTFQNLLNQKTGLAGKNDDIDDIGDNFEINFEINIEVKQESNQNKEQQVEKNDDRVPEKKTNSEDDKEKKTTNGDKQKTEISGLSDEKKINNEKNVKDRNRDLKTGDMKALLANSSNHAVGKEKLETRTIKIHSSDLDAKSRDSIKSIMKDLKNGKIGRNEADSLTLKVLQGADLKKTGIDKKDITALSPDKQKIGHVEIKIQSLKMTDKNETLPSEGKEVKAGKEDKNGKIKIDDLRNLKTTEDKKVARKANEKNVSTDVSRDPEIKDSKSEFRLDLNDLKPVVGNSAEKTTGSPKDILNDNKEKIFDNIAKNTRIVLSNNETKFSTMIRPENLGRIDMKFTVKDGKIEGRMILQNQEAADFFKANVEDLKAVFSKSNVEMGNIDIALAGQNHASLNGNGNNGSNRDDSAKMEFVQSISKAARTFDDNNVSEVFNKVYDNSMVNIFI
jgi:flagellar hook-length control protein FliK